MFTLCECVFHPFLLLCVFFCGGCEWKQSKVILHIISPFVLIVLVVVVIINVARAKPTKKNDKTQKIIIQFKRNQKEKEKRKKKKLVIGMGVVRWKVNGGGTGSIIKFSIFFGLSIWWWLVAVDTREMNIDWNESWEKIYKVNFDFVKEGWELRRKKLYFNFRNTFSVVSVQYYSLCLFCVMMNEWINKGE